MPPGFTDSQLYDLFRPFGALASVRAHTQFGPDTGMVEFWNEDDARMAEEAMHCAEVDGQNIAVQVYQQRRTSGAEFNVTAPAFVPSGNVFQYTNQVGLLSTFCKNGTHQLDSNIHHRHPHSVNRTVRGALLPLSPSSTVLVSRCS